ncbi:MAG: hypothetical protein A2202_00605 [Bdellovibrionales bacterium RIFOXYA1_FULL_36_14]|nr:MAG: hypothetical protein A2202_00605 [Bdellovibrionales bacterium RIFOXYA1_FULL_36_14]
MEQTMSQVAATTPINEAIANTSLIEDIAIFMNDGGVFMWIILAIWIFGILITLERFKSYAVFDTKGDSLMNMIKKHVLLNNVQEAIKICSSSKALLPYVLKSGLKRANQSKEQIQDAIESSMLEVQPKIERWMGYLQLVANISTLFGLLGTIQGLIGSFSAVATADPASKAKLLAIGISTAMNTTALGLLSAITIMIAYQVLLSKHDKITGEIEEYSVKLIDLLGTKKGGSFTVSGSSEAPDITKAA